LLVNRFEPGKRRLINLIAILICLSYALLMFYGAFEFVQRLFTLGHSARDLPVERWLLTIMLPIGFGLLFLRFVQLGLAIWRGEVTGLGVNELEAHDLDIPAASGKSSPGDTP
jgi:C4-dicarboxylate transporter DctQ subunit